MATSYYPRLADLIDLSQLPAPLDSLANGQSVLSSTFYQNFSVDLTSNNGDFTASIDLVLFKELRFGVAGFALIINPNPDGTTSTTLPLALSYGLGLRRYVPDYNPLSPPSTAAAYYPLLQAVAGVSARDLLPQALGMFGALPVASSTLTMLDLFAQQANTRYASQGLAIGVPLPAGDDAALTQLEAKFAALPSGGPTLAQAIFDLYLADADEAVAQSNLARLFTPLLGLEPLERIDGLARPDLSVSAHLTAAVELPGSLLVPVKKTIQGATTTYTPDSTKPAQLLFDAGDFLFSTQNGFGFVGAVGISLPTDYPRLQLGSTGFQLEFSTAKVDLSGRNRLAESQADGRPSDFRGIYIDSASAFLPPEWRMQEGAGVPVINASQLLIGTGGVSGTFSATPATGSTQLFTAHLFGDISVEFTRFALALSQNNVVYSDVAGTFSLASFKGTDGQPVKFPFDLEIAADGYQLTFTAPTLNGQQKPLIVKIGSVLELHFTKLAFGKDAHGFYLDLAADVQLTRPLPLIGKVLPSQIAVSQLRFSTGDGTTVHAQPVWPDGTTVSGDLTKGIPLSKTLSLTILKVLKIDHITLALSEDANGLHASALFNASLGLTDDSAADQSAADSTPPPGFRASITNAGLTATLKSVPKDSNGTTTSGDSGNLSLLNIELGTKLPDGASMSINAGGLIGTGSLAILDNGTRYEGVLSLAFRDTLHLAAFGILQENLPDGGAGPSLLALITAQFNPIQLGLGFTLNAVGGLLGLHRTTNTEYLRGLVRNGEMNKLLFPAPASASLSDLTSTLAVIDAAFPAASGRYVIGLMAQLGWGTPSIITLDVALLVEMPAPIRIAILGVLQAILPSRDNDLLKLRADFLGLVDFGAKKVSFDATLTDSHILRFALTGDIAFRLYQGSNPLFVITAGGFHPAFQPPAGAALTGLKRLTLSLAQGNDLRLTLASYFAVTSNTVQFGSHLDLYLSLRLGLHVEGHFGFDVLFQFSPFKVLAHVEAGIAIMRGDSELIGLHLSLDVTGPGPWHIWGDASFRIWFVKIRVGVDATIGDNAATEQTLPAPNVHDLLVAALQEPASWEVEAPASALPGGVTLRPAVATAGQLFLDPRGTLVLRQRITPLGLTLEKYGSSKTKPTGGSRFELVAMKVGDTTYDQAANLENVSDSFAPDQYRLLSDAQKLSSPSFQLLPNGLRLKSLSGLQGAPTGTRRVVEYERLLLDGSQTGTASGGSIPAKLKLSSASFRKMTRNSALGQAYQVGQASARVPKPVNWSEDTYEVVNADTLEPYSLDHQEFTSQVEAEQYRQAVVAAQPALELLVVPTYQLALA